MICHGGCFGFCHDFAGGDFVGFCCGCSSGGVLMVVVWGFGFEREREREREILLLQIYIFYCVDILFQCVV